MSEPTTDVMLRRWRSGGRTVIALFPGEEWARGQCASYERIGQHGGADLAGVMAATRPADPERERDAAALVRELEGLGYRLRIVRRRLKREG